MLGHWFRTLFQTKNFFTPSLKPFNAFLCNTSKLNFLENYWKGPSSTSLPPPTTSWLRISNHDLHLSLLQTKAFVWIIFAAWVNDNVLWPQYYKRRSYYLPQPTHRLVTAKFDRYQKKWTPSNWKWRAHAQLFQQQKSEACTYTGSFVIKTGFGEQKTFIARSASTRI